LLQCLVLSFLGTRFKTRHWSMTSSETILAQLLWWNIFSNLMFCWPCIVIYQYNRANKMHYLLSFFFINSLYMFRALFCSSSGGTVCTATGIFLCLLCRLAASRVGVEAINRNKLKVNSASCWSYYTEVSFPLIWLQRRETR
jgi:hypothetical protein